MNEREKNYRKDTLCVQAGYHPSTGESRIPPVSYTHLTLPTNSLV